MNEKIKQKYKDLFITLIEEEDWVGARNLLDNIVNHAAITVATSPTEHPVVEQSHSTPNDLGPQPTEEDNLRAAKYA